MSGVTREEAVEWAVKHMLTAAEAKLEAQSAYSALLASGQVDLAKKELRKTTALTRTQASWLKLAKIWQRGSKVRLKVSFSGGKTSAYMAKRIKDLLSHLFDIVFIFANTGREHEKTLEFVDRCDREWGLNVAWVEAIVHPEQGKASTHRTVSFLTASRNGEPFEEVIKVYGISNLDFEPCNRELKLNAMKSYMRSIGWDDYFTAIGIRADEKRRVSALAGANQVLYPLVDLWSVDKQDVADFWEDQPFQLGLPEHLGNCKTCWKKSDRKLFMVYSEAPEEFDWNERMERMYGWHGAPHYGTPVDGVRPRVWFRNYRSTKDLIAQAREAGAQAYIPIKEMYSHSARQFSLDFESGGCTESCEPFQMTEIA